MKFKNVFITGATGYIGRHLVKAFAGQNIKVFVLTRNYINKELEEYWKDCDIFNIKIELSRVGKLKKILCENKFNDLSDSVFIHLGWEGASSLTDGGIEAQMKNVIYASECLQAASSIGCKKFINIGSAQEVFLEENLIEREDISQSDYAIAKLGSRDIVKILGYLNKIDTAHITFSVPLDINLSGTGYVPTSLRKIINKEEIDLPKSNQIFDLISMSDLVSAIKNIAYEGENQKNYYIGSGIFKTLANHFKDFSKYIYSSKPPKNIVDVPSKNLDPYLNKKNFKLITKTFLEEFIIKQNEINT